ncbi:hypothetical protein B0H14DRAFT_3467025 [Mycena olivaceomarginata]|nr:hypothetical protein B0H14DRAFT_3467025 [Mycena olivaceomarginata]
MPTGRFLAPKLTESDLRATFLLLPSSPSLINHLKNFSSWMPDSVFKNDRQRDLGQEHDAKTIIDLALESFSISVPLIEFHDATSQCANESGETTAAPTEPEDQSLKGSVEAHPYVVTRTQLRLVRETGLFNATAYNAVRDESKPTRLGIYRTIKPSLKRCRRTYKSNGIFETLLELEVPTESGVETQWAYAPYLDTKKHATGPSENPGKQILADNFVSPQLVDHRATELEKLSRQDEAELWNGALGHRFHDDAHPRRRIGVQIVIVLDLTQTGCLAVGLMLQFYYWWTRVSTVGISTSGAAFQVLGLTLSALVEMLQSNEPSMIFVLPLTVVVPY